jgi:hypothetical protein
MLRRAFASLCFFAGRDLKWTMGQLRHEDAHMSAAVYAQGAQRSRIDYELVWTLMRFADEPEHWADRHVPRAAFGPRIDPTAGRRTSTNRRMSDGRGWFRTTDLSRVNRLGVREVERPDRPPFRAILAFDARVVRHGDAARSGRIRLDPGSTALTSRRAQEVTQETGIRPRDRYLKQMTLATLPAPGVRHEQKVPCAGERDVEQPALIVEFAPALGSSRHKLVLACSDDHCLSRQSLS